VPVLAKFAPEMFRNVGNYHSNVTSHKTWSFIKCMKSTFPVSSSCTTHCQSNALLLSLKYPVSELSWWLDVTLSLLVIKR